MPGLIEQWFGLPPQWETAAVGAAKPLLVADRLWPLLAHCTAHQSFEALMGRSAETFATTLVVRPVYRFPRNMRSSSIGSQQLRQIANHLESVGDLTERIHVPIVDNLG
jgi:hypothetical protein